MIQGIKREIGRGELPLRQQRTEDEHRMIAALPRLGDVDPGKVAAASHCDAFGRFALGGDGRCSVRVLRPRAPNRLRQRERRLRERRQRRGRGDEQDREDDAGRTLDCQKNLQVTGAILRERSPVAYARKVEFLDRTSGTVRMLCADTGKLCPPSAGKSKAHGRVLRSPERSALEGRDVLHR